MGEVNRNLYRIGHISDAILQIEKFTLNFTEDKFCKDYLVQSGVLYQFSIIGEAIQHIDKDILELIDYPWHMVRGFRNFIAHEYHKLEMEAVWGIVTNDLPTLKLRIEELKKHC
jgi:uncharacterized protein with HEPN domain